MQAFKDLVNVFTKEGFYRADFLIKFIVEIPTEVVLPS